VRLATAADDRARRAWACLWSPEPVDSSLVSNGFSGTRVMSNTEGACVGVRLRAASAGDEDFLFALYASTRQDEMAAWRWEAAQQEMFLRLQFRAQQQRHAAECEASDHQIIYRDGAPVGRILV